MKIFLTSVLLLLCGICTMAQNIALPAIYKGEDVMSSTKTPQLKPLLLSQTPVINNVLTPMTGRFLKEFCISHDPFDFATVTAERANAQRVKLVFETVNEYSSSSFIIERAIAKGTEHAEILRAEDTSYSLLYKTGTSSVFDQVDKKYARNAGAEKVKYELTDNNTYTGISFYRITEVGYDQTMISSKIVAVIGTPLKETITLFPNPAVNQPTAIVYSKTTGAGRLQVFNNHGTILKEIPVNIISGTNNLTVPVSGLTAGSYFIRIIRKDSQSPLETQFLKM